MRRFRPIVALVAAYGLLFAALIGALGTARAATPGFQLCIAGKAGDMPAPVRAEHELCCILACCAGGQPTLAAGAIAPIANSLGRENRTPAIAAAPSRNERASAAAPRGPPSRA